VLGRSHIIPARDFDAAIFVREVHAARLLMLSPGLDRLLHMYGWLLDHVVAVSVASAGLLGAIVHRWRRRRRVRIGQGKEGRAGAPALGVAPSAPASSCYSAAKTPISATSFGRLTVNE
jgi:hypothetical protein